MYTTTIHCCTVIGISIYYQIIQLTFQAYIDSLFKCSEDVSLHISFVAYKTLSTGIETINIAQKLTFSIKCAVLTNENIYVCHSVIIENI